jgi:hypothetical protein
MQTDTYEGNVRQTCFCAFRQKAVSCDSWIASRRNKLIYFYLFNYWFSASVICGISPPTVAAISSLDRLIFCVAHFATGHLKMWCNSQAVTIWMVVVPNDRYYYYFALNCVNLFKVKCSCCLGMTGEVPLLSDISSGEFVHTRVHYKFRGEGCTA